MRVAHAIVLLSRICLTNSLRLMRKLADVHSPSIICKPCSAGIKELRSGKDLTGLEVEEIEGEEIAHSASRQSFSHTAELEH